MTEESNEFPNHQDPESNLQPMKYTPKSSSSKNGPSKSSSGKSRTMKKTPKQILQAKVPTEIADGKYRVGNRVGKGAFGAVYKAYDLGTTQPVAIKAIPTNNINKQRLKTIMQEVELLKELPEHPNIVKYIDSKQEQGFLFIILEFVEEGSLQTLMKHLGGKFNEKVTALYIFQILLGLQFLHKEGIIHRDIKAANVLVKEGKAKLTDFGVAIKRDNDSSEENNNIEKDDVAGSPYWMAPEIIEMSGQITTACDVWGVGATAIELLTGHPPYFSVQPLTALFRIVQDRHPPYPPQISQLFEGFLNRCFVKEAQHRANAEELIKSTWFTKTLTIEEHDKFLSWAGLKKKPIRPKKPPKKPKPNSDQKTTKKPPVVSDGEMSDVGSGKETWSSSEEATDPQPKEKEKKKRGEKQRRGTNHILSQCRENRSHSSQQQHQQRIFARKKTRDD